MQYKYDDIKMVFIPNHNSYDETRKKIKEIKQQDPKTIIFTSFLENNKENLNNKNYTCFFNPTLDLCIWKIE